MSAMVLRSVPVRPESRPSRPDLASEAVRSDKSAGLDSDMAEPKLSTGLIKQIHQTPIKQILDILYRNRKWNIVDLRDGFPLHPCRHLHNCQLLKGELFPEMNPIIVSETLYYSNKYPPLVTIVFFYFPIILIHREKIFSRSAGTGYRHRESV